MSSVRVHVDNDTYVRYKYNDQLLDGITIWKWSIKVRLDKSLKPHGPRNSQKSALRDC